LLAGQVGVVALLHGRIAGDAQEGVDGAGDGPLQVQAGEDGAAEAAGRRAAAGQVEHGVQHPGLQEEQFEPEAVVLQMSDVYGGLSARLRKSARQGAVRNPVPLTLSAAWRSAGERGASAP